MPRYSHEEMLDYFDDRLYDGAEVTFAATDREAEQCEGCNSSQAEPLLWIGDGWNFRGCRVCASECARQLAEEGAREPNCACRQTDVDLFDSRGCALHDPSSDYNAHLRAVTLVDRYKQAVA